MMTTYINHGRRLPLIFLLVFYLTALAAPGAARADDPRASSLTEPRTALVEVVFVLDTTGSMSGLIDAAKTKIWSIANTLASAESTPDIRMGLVAYRDRGDAYVTRLTGLSQDLDGVYANLMQFEADGGGDTPESVNQALYEAVTRSPWSPLGSKAYRVIFLVGDAPPQMNYRDDVRYAESCRLAAQRGIVINTIQCGDRPETTPVWKDIARLGRGDYFHVAQSGSAVLYDTPYDEKIASLSRALDGTRIYYGSAAEQAESEARRKTADSIYAKAKPAAMAQRTVFNASKAGEKNFAGSRELVQDVKSGRVQADKIDRSLLPAELRKMKADELKALIGARGKQRAGLQLQIKDLSKKRQTWIQAKLREEKETGAHCLDNKVFKCIKGQAADQGIIYKGGPVY